ncbi:hypothetical protein Q5P01_000323 [Channa striata]|uniref:Uncharacterized protein n=1 Tax=Channa striata TaxID=64152 RepID=A0AA88IGZ1_CHASR|nr:hypothetical protein Q5P01_000323 [Channa striata]
MLSRKYDIAHHYALFDRALGLYYSSEARSAPPGEKEVTDPGGWLDRSAEEHAALHGTPLVGSDHARFLGGTTPGSRCRQTPSGDDEPTGGSSSSDGNGRGDEQAGPSEKGRGGERGGGRSAEVAPRAETDRDRAGEHPPMTERTRATKEGEDGGKELGEKDAPLSRAVSAKPAPCGNYTYHEFNNLAGTLTDGPGFAFSRVHRPYERRGELQRLGELLPEPHFAPRGPFACTRAVGLDQPRPAHGGPRGPGHRQGGAQVHGHLQGSPEYLARNSAREPSDAPCYNEVFLPGRPVSRLNLDVDLKCCLGCSARFSSGADRSTKTRIPALVSSASRHSGVPAEIGEGEAQRARGGPAISRTWETRWALLEEIEKTPSGTLCSHPAEARAGRAVRAERLDAEGAARPLSSAAEAREPDRTARGAIGGQGPALLRKRGGRRIVGKRDLPSIRGYAQRSTTPRTALRGPAPVRGSILQPHHLGRDAAEIASRDRRKRDPRRLAFASPTRGRKGTGPGSSAGGERGSETGRAMGVPVTVRKSGSGLMCASQRGLAPRSDHAPVGLPTLTPLICATNALTSACSRPQSLCETQRFQSMLVSGSPQRTASGVGGVKVLYDLHGLPHQESASFRFLGALARSGGAVMLARRPAEYHAERSDQSLAGSQFLMSATMFAPGYRRRRASATPHLSGRGTACICCPLRRTDSGAPRARSRRGSGVGRLQRGCHRAGRRWRRSPILSAIN